MMVLRASSPDSVHTVSVPATASILVLGSKFLAAIAPAQTAADADAFLEIRSRRYPDASHHCWAYRVGRPGDLEERSTDGGEPFGTAGRPILDALKSAQLENVICVVSRYFGGTKLGTGGLARAYNEAANFAMAQSAVVTLTIMRTVALDFDHDRTGIVYRALDEFGVQFHQGGYDERVHGRIDVPLSKTEPLRKRLFELARTGIDWREDDLRLK